ncbi:choice-of-anchor J domain-containing protein [Flavobacterium sp.]|uniref:choice-of-anchor J domain-containing protein n=1 Tax=Flavobacterium sp. TaxID=239 RepID=UPI004033684E
MKIKLFLSLALLPFGALAQFPDQDFENFILLPNEWGLMDDAGFNEKWMPTEPGNAGQPPYQGEMAIYLPPGTMPQGEVTDDWLMTPRFTAVAGRQLQFYSRLLQEGDQGSIYGVYISTHNVQLYPQAYTLIEQWTETELNPVQAEYTLVSVPIPDSYSGQQIYMAFRMNTNGGDGWLIDNASIKSTLGNSDLPKKQIKIYPNPAQDLLHIDVTDISLRSVAIHDTNGRLCISSGNTEPIDVAGLEAGVYFVKATTDTGLLVSKLVKQ